MSRSKSTRRKLTVATASTGVAVAIATLVGTSVGFIECPGVPYLETSEHWVARLDVPKPSKSKSKAKAKAKRRAPKKPSYAPPPKKNAPKKSRKPSRKSRAS